MSVSIEDLSRVIRWHTRQWQGHPEYDDMLAEAYLKGWQSYLNTGSTTAALTGAQWGPGTWLRKWSGRPDQAPLRSNAVFTPLDECLHVSDEGAAAAAVEERLEADALWEMVWSVCTLRQAEVIYRTFVLGETLEDAGAEMGVTMKAAWEHRDKGLERLRRHLTEPHPAPQTVPNRRVEHCVRGHLQSPENVGTYTHKGRRMGRCRECQRLAVRASRERKALR